MRKSRFKIYILNLSADTKSAAGCGKRTVVKYVARRLGLHLVEYSCHNLMASSERKGSSVLAQAFTFARRYHAALKSDRCKGGFSL